MGFSEVHEGGLGTGFRAPFSFLGYLVMRLCEKKLKCWLLPIDDVMKHYDAEDAGRVVLTKHSSLLKSVLFWQGFPEFTRSYEVSRRPGGYDLRSPAEFLSQEKMR